MIRNRKTLLRCFSTSLLSGVMLLFPGWTYAQSELRSLMELAEKNYPLIAAKQAEAEAGEASARLEKNTLMPSLDAAYQANYATYNNITGMNLPGQLIPISGPPSSDNFGAVPGSAASLLMKWSPFTFGQRAASVDYYQNHYEKQLAAVEDEVLKVKFQVALLYLEMATTQELIKAYEKNIERNEFNTSRIGFLVDAGLRPAVDSLKFRGELSKAKTELYQLQNLRESQEYQLQELVVSEGLTGITTDSAFFKNLPENADWLMSSDSLTNPRLKMAQMNLLAEQARLKQINRSWTPNLEVWGTTYARASGIGFDGTVDQAEGFSFSRYNYGVGLQLVLPILNLTNVKIKSSRQRAIARSSQEYLTRTEIALKREENIVMNDLRTSLLIAKEVPTEYKAAESAFNALQVRYNEGLINYTDLIQAQYDLLNAEAKLKSAYASTWKALLSLAVIRGDLDIFLNELGG
ncbi:outer membrane protein TolC [Algoriphagus sp. 4150]|uniref:TolC family protein n=1 Tax=Algoriphagus sp. 4150 TaxID=2817756 RepID=UPI00285B2F1F|nr:TolC family protein [Algoriphagus sp. 4150]MDR7129765.1 outer membrane protein TolC [Algoriphagus sp. 4150]